VLSIVTRSEGRWGEPQPIPGATGFARGARWAPNGDLIAYATPDAIFAIPSAGGEPTALARRKDATVPVPWAVAWSPDGRTLFFKSFGQDSVPRIWSIPADGGEPQLKVDFGYPIPRTVGPDFATDGERFYFTIPETEGDVWLIELELE
jgi:hypothetical protein